MISHVQSEFFLLTISFGIQDDQRGKHSGNVTPREVIGF